MNLTSGMEKNHWERGEDALHKWVRGEVRKRNLSEVEKVFKWVSYK